MYWREIWMLSCTYMDDFVFAVYPISNLISWARAVPLSWACHHTQGKWVASSIFLASIRWRHSVTHSVYSMCMYNIEIFLISRRCLRKLNWITLTLIYIFSFLTMRIHFFGTVCIYVCIIVYKDRHSVICVHMKP